MVLTTTFESSSCLSQARFDEAKGQLEVTIRKTGLQYTYTGVTREVYDGLVSSSSAGAYYNQNIRNAYQLV